LEEQTEGKELIQTTGRKDHREREVQRGNFQDFLVEGIEVESKGGYRAGIWEPVDESENYRGYSPKKQRG